MINYHAYFGEIRAVLKTNKHPSWTLKLNPTTFSNTWEKNPSPFQMLWSSRCDCMYCTGSAHTVPLPDMCYCCFFWTGKYISFQPWNVLGSCVWIFPNLNRPPNSLFSFGSSISFLELNREFWYSFGLERSKYTTLVHTFQSWDICIDLFRRDGDHKYHEDHI